MQRFSDKMKIFEDLSVDGRFKINIFPCIQIGALIKNSVIWCIVFLGPFLGRQWRAMLYAQAQQQQI